LDSTSGEADRVIGERFRKQTINYIVNGVVQGYTIASSLAEDVPWLNQTLRGRAKLPHLRNVAIEAILLEMASLGEIPFDGREVLTKNKSHAYAEFRSPECIMTISYVHRPGQFPRGAFFRRQLSANNIQQVLFHEYRQDDNSNILYTVLTHGGNNENLLFASIGAPLPGFRKWGLRLPIFRWQDIRKLEADEVIKHVAKKPSLKKSIIERLISDEREEQ